MIIVSNFMDDITINNGEFHTISFESSYMQQLFRILINDHFSNKRNNLNEIEKYYLNVIDKRTRQTFSNKDFYFINFDCNSVDLKNEKNTKTMIQDYLFHFIENNDKLMEPFVKFNHEMEKFINNLSFIHDKIVIDFESTDKTIQQIIKSLTMHIEYDESEIVPNYILRDYIIQSLLQMNYHEKEPLLLITFPEADVGREDFLEVVNLIKKLNITTLVLSTACEIVTSADLDNIILVKNNGFIYNIVKLAKEMEALNILNNNRVENIAKKLVFHDFTKDYDLLNPKWKEFLLSARF